MERKHKLRSILAFMLTFVVVLGGLLFSFVSAAPAKNSLTFSGTVDGVKVTVEAEEGVFPEGATLSVEKVTLEQEKKAEEAVESERDEDKQVAASYTYDIKVLDQDGNEIQPADESKVKVSFKLEEVADSNLETNIYHIKEADPNGTDSGEKAGNDKADSEETSEASGADSDNKVLILPTPKSGLNALKMWV